MWQEGADGEGLGEEIGVGVRLDLSGHPHLGKCADLFPGPWEAVGGLYQGLAKQISVVLQLHRAEHSAFTRSSHCS